jgi:hypothetical protein
VTSHNSDSPRDFPAPYTVEETAQRTREFIKASDGIVEMRKAIDAQFPDVPAASRDLSVATLVIENNLGIEWVKRHIDGQAIRSGGSNYLRSRPSNSMERHERYLRVMELGRRVFELGQERFAERLLENLRRRDLAGAAFEADVVRMLVSLPMVVDLRAERGTKGGDYDIDLWLRPDLCWAFEVKTCADHSLYSDKALSRTLDRARSQLPATGIGIIFLKVPTQWLGSGNYLRSHSDVVSGFLRQTRRVQAVVLVWDAWIPKTIGSGFNWKRGFRTYRTERVNEELDFLLDAFSEFWRAPWDIGPTAPF